jgi:HEAT repeat protein
MTQRRRTADEFLAFLEADPEYQARRRVFEARLAAERAILAAAEAPLVAELKAAGFAVESVWDLVNTDESYTAALPILLDHLQRDYPDKVREGIARAMAVRESKFAWQTLIRLFRAQFDPNPNGVKGALAVALSEAADDEGMADLIELFKEPRHGESRIFFVTTLKRSKLANARAALEAGRQDPQLVKEIVAVLDRPKRRSRKNAT